MKLLTSYKNLIATSLLAMCFTFNASGGEEAGACCFDANNCSVLLVSDCIKNGGTY